MYPRVAEYLEPIHIFAKYCGVLPISSSLTDSAVSRCYFIYCLFILLLPASNIAFSCVYYYMKFTDVVCFTTVGYVGLRVAVHTVSIMAPFVRSNAYIKLFKRLNYVEMLIHSLNINQKAYPSKACQLVWIILKLSTDVVLFSITRVYQNIPLVVSLGFFAVYYSTFGSMLQIVALLKVIKCKFIIINWHLLYLNNKIPPYLTGSDKRAFIENKIRYGQSTDNFIDLSVPNIRTFSAFKVRTFNRIHFLLCVSSNLISNYFSLQLFLSILKICIECIVMCILSSDPRKLFSNVVSAIGYLVYGFLGVWWVYLMAKLCHDIKVEVK